MKTKTYVRRSNEAVAYDIKLDHVSIDAAHAARDAIKELTTLDASIPVVIRTALRYLNRHIQDYPHEANADTAKLRLKLDVLAAAKGVVGS